MSSQQSNGGSGKIVIQPEEVAEAAVPKAPIPSVPASPARSPRSQTPPVTSRVSSVGTSQDKWFVGAAIGAAVLVVGIAGGILIVVFSSGGDSLPNSSDRTAATSKARGRATQEYWNQLVSIVSSVNQNLAESATGGSIEQIRQKRNLMASASSQVSRLPVLDVDSEAVEIGSRLVQQFGDQEAVFSACERLVTDAGAVNERVKSPDFLFESFLRGFAGDPLGAQNDLRAEQGKLSARHERLMEQAEACQRSASELRSVQGRVRAALAGRYGFEFAPLD